LQFTEGLKVADRFRLVRELGRGGMGAVWLAEHTGLDVLCAIKLIDPRGKESAELRARFENEAKAAAQLKSRHVVQILDHGVWNDIPYIAMEYLQGEDLASRIARMVRLPLAETLRIVSQVCRALTRAHGAGIVHRDLKPENIFLAREDDTEIAKVLDFGIAKRASMQLSDSSTKTGSLVGTPFYMSPEQARGTRAIDHRSDLFSLAVITFECLTGELPFAGEGLGEVLGKIMYEDLPLPSNFVPVLANGFDTWWQKAAAREPEHRFQSAKEFSESLALALGVTQTFDIAPLTSSPDLTGEAQPFRVSRDYRSQDEVHTIMALPEEVLGQKNGTTGDPLTRTFAPVQKRSTLRWWVAGVVAAAGTVVAAAFLLRPHVSPAVPSPAAAAPAAATPAPSPVSEPAPPPPATSVSEAPIPSAAPVEKKPASSRKNTRRSSPQRSSGSKSSGKSPKVVDFGI
jgi:eukaryotic-like serine/threonine-protein kinase